MWFTSFCVVLLLNLEFRKYIFDFESQITQNTGVQSKQTKG